MDELITRQAAADLLRMAIIDGWEPDYAEDKLNVIPSVPAIPLAWIDYYITTCQIFDLRANGVPAEKIIKTMVKIWERENPGGKKGGDNGKT